MAKRKQTGPTWSDVKAVLGNMEQKQLIQLVGDLYRLSKDNKDFLHARFAVVGNPLAPYKKIIEECMYPDVMKDKPIQISRAKGAISQYSKAAEDPVGEAELMTFFVECGNSFTVEFGDIDVGFYEALNLMYRRVIAKVLSLPPEKLGEFQDRLEQIMTSSKDIGWGYHDELCHDYYKAFPEDE